MPADKQNWDEVSPDYEQLTEEDEREEDEVI